MYAAPGTDRREAFEGLDVVHIACEDLEFSWTRDELRRFRGLWAVNISLHQIAEMLGRDPDECLILAIDQLRHDRIRPRRNGLTG